MIPLANGLLSSSEETVFSPPINEKTQFSKLVISNPSGDTYTYVIRIKFSSGNIIQHLAGQLGPGEMVETLQDIVIISPEQLIVKSNVAGKLSYALYGDNQAK